MTHPMKLAAEMCHSPKVAARATGLTQREVREIRAKKAARSQQKLFVDPLLRARDMRPHRRSSVVAAREHQIAERNAQRDAEVAASERRAEHRKATRATLIAAARVARSMGYGVRASKGRDGRISSYYLTLDGGSTLRISDHEIPWTVERESNSTFRNGTSYSGFHGPELLIDGARSATWLRRAIRLAAAGRSVPGA